MRILYDYKQKAYLENSTWAGVVKLAAPVIQKMEISNVACVLPILFPVYLTPQLNISIYLHMIHNYPVWWEFLTYDGLKYHVNVTEGPV